ncbi:hypothetical protein SUGI_0454620 [Cryptomeria japonica]|nr:hypothetical protein SUGI_0454620 [Cryptomeria japonica]
MSTSSQATSHSGGSSRSSGRSSWHNNQSGGSRRLDRSSSSHSQAGSVMGPPQVPGRQKREPMTMWSIQWEGVPIYDVIDG